MAQTLYRKYRSQRFAEIVGQKPVIRILSNSIQKERMNHAYLFAGPRGTGKTSIARIFAKAINCENPAGGDACGVCSVCTSIAEGRAVDVIEIDAASNRGIENIRDLREKVGYAPLNFRYKLYIIDEVHMITREGFNALLKTLEEPPAHVIFLLCTTEPAKLPMTILSRCIRFDLQRLPLLDLAQHLVGIAAAEGFAMELPAATKLAELAECSARDAISLLDQLLVFCDHEITLEAIGELFQLGSDLAAAQLVDSLCQSETATAVGTWQELVAQGIDPGRFLLQVAADLKARYLATREQRYLDALHAAWEGVNLLKQESFPALLVELSLLNIQSRLTASATPAAVAPPSTARTAEPPPTRPNPPAAAPPLTAAPATSKSVEVPTAATPPAKPVQPAAAGPQVTAAATTHVADELWTRYLAELQRSRLTTFALVAQHVSLEQSGNRFILAFMPAGRQAYHFAQKAEHLAALNVAASAVLDRGATVQLRIVGEPDSLVPKLATGKPSDDELPDELRHDILDDSEQASPAAAVDPAKLEAAALDVVSDLKSRQQATDTPSVQEAITLFDATELDPEEEP